MSLIDVATGYVIADTLSKTAPKPAPPSAKRPKEVYTPSTGYDPSDPASLSANDRKEIERQNREATRAYHEEQQKKEQHKKGIKTGELGAPWDDTFTK